MKYSNEQILKDRYFRFEIARITTILSKFWIQYKYYELTGELIATVVEER